MKCTFCEEEQTNWHEHNTLLEWWEDAWMDGFCDWLLQLSPNQRMNNLARILVISEREKYED